MVKRNINTWDLYLTVYNKLISKQYGGFLIISSGRYYLQMYVVPDEEKEDTGAKCIHIEAVSHYYLPEKKDFSEQFKSIGFEIDPYFGNYVKECPIKLLSADYLIELTNNVFTIFGVGIPPYDINWSFDNSKTSRDAWISIKEYDDSISGINIKHKQIFHGTEVIEGIGYKIQLFDKWGILDKNYNPILPCIYDNIYYYYDSMIVVIRDYKIGFLDKNLKEIIPCKYDDSRIVDESRAWVAKEDKWGLIDKNGGVIIPFIYDYVRKAENGIIWVVKDDKWGLIDESGKQLLPFIYDKVGPISMGKVWVKNENLNAIINLKGDLIQNCNYEGITGLEYAHAIVSDGNGKCGIIDDSYNEIIPLKYDSIRLQPEGYIYELTDESGMVESKYVSYDGDTIMTESQYCGRWSEEEASEFYRLENERKDRLKDKYDSIWQFSEGLSRVRKDGKYGFIDANDNVIIPLIYSVAKNFSEGLAAVKEGDKYGYINQKGELVIDCQFNDATNFCNGYGNVRMSNKKLWGAINQEGKLVIDCKYDHIYADKEGFIYVMIDHKHGFYNKDGSIIIQPVFDNLYMKDGIITAYKDNLIFKLDCYGNQVAPIVNKSQN